MYSTMSIKPTILVIYLEKRERYIKEARIENLLNEFTNIYSANVIQLSDRVLETEPVENWPLCDISLTLYLDKYNYPPSILDKISNYTSLRKPYILNNCEFREVLRNRIDIYKILHELEILTPTFEVGDYKNIQKPFIEKPVSADEHDIVIYHAEGGSTKIQVKPEFGTKIKESENSIPRCDSAETQNLPPRTFIYEQFLENATEVKIKVIGDNYAHGEARDGTDKGVQRDTKNQRETRVSTELTEQELEYAAKIQRTFKQFFIGFDVLRYEGKSYVIDVNDQAWLPKTGRKEFFRNAAILMGQKIIREAAFLNLTLNITNQLDEGVAAGGWGVVS